MNKLTWKKIREQLARLKGKVPNRNSDGDRIKYLDRAMEYHLYNGIAGVREYVDKVLELRKA